MIRAQAAFIGGSSTLAADFPRGLEEIWGGDGRPSLRVLEENLVYQTPYGESPPFCRFQLGERLILSCRLHGWRPGLTRAEASRRVFWVLREAGVATILGEGGVGAINHLLQPGDILVPSDYVDQSMRRDVELDGGYLLVMRQALCPRLRETLRKAAQEVGGGRVFGQGIYLVTDGRHFESPAEINFYRLSGADVVGQSLCPEVYLAREIGACYASLQLVVNMAEGVGSPWEHAELADLFYNQGRRIGKMILAALSALPEKRDCNCRDLRKPTLLKT